MNKKPSLAESMRSAVQGGEPAAVAPAPIQAPKAAAVSPVATRAGKKKVTAQIAPEDHKRLRRLALDRDISAEALLIEAISDLFIKYGARG